MGLLKAPGSPSTPTQNLIRLAWGVVLATHGPDSSGGVPLLAQLGQGGCTRQHTPGQHARLVQPGLGGVAAEGCAHVHRLPWSWVLHGPQCSEAGLSAAFGGWSEPWWVCMVTRRGVRCR